MTRANQALAESEAPVLLTVIGGDIEDDEEEAPTVVGTDLASLGLPHLELVTPRWEQPEGVGDADTAPEKRSPVASEPLDPSRTFPPADEVSIVAVEAEVEEDEAPAAPYAEQAAMAIAAPAEPAAPAPVEEGSGIFGIVAAVSIGVAIVGAAALGIALLWAI